MEGLIDHYIIDGWMDLNLVTTLSSLYGGKIFSSVCVCVCVCAREKAFDSSISVRLLLFTLSAPSLLFLHGMVLFYENDLAIRPTGIFALNTHI